MAEASARHILVDTEEQCLQLKESIANGEDFGDVAKKALQLSIRSTRR